MSEDGVFCVSRRVFRHPMFEGEAYSRRDAWLWLLGNAVWKETRVRVKNSIISLSRGQCAYSLRFLAVQWRWSKNKVAAFLAQLVNEQMIGTQAGRDATLITICNYDQYQFSPGHRRDANRDAEGTQTGRGRDKEEEINNTLKGEAPSAPLIEQPSEEAELYRLGRKILGKSAGGVITKLVKAKGGSILAARAALDLAAKKGNANEYIARVISGPAATGSDFYSKTAGIL